MSRPVLRHHGLRFSDWPSLPQEMPHQSAHKCPGRGHVSVGELGRGGVTHYSQGLFGRGQYDGSVCQAAPLLGGPRPVSPSTQLLGRALMFNRMRSLSILRCPFSVACGFGFTEARPPRAKGMALEPGQCVAAWAQTHPR